MTRPPPDPCADPSLSVVIVEDDDELRDVLVAVLSGFGHEVRGTRDGPTLDLLLTDFDPDILVLDLNLPGEDGFDIAARMRRDSGCGIIMTTSRGQVQDRVDGFRTGADIYLVKPIDPRELNAALVNLGQRLRPGRDGGRRPWRFERSQSALFTPRGVRLDLTAQENTVLGLLLAMPGETVSRQALIAALGHPDDEFGGKRLETLFSRLRSKALRVDAQSELPIKARHSLGYAFLSRAECG